MDSQSSPIEFSTVIADSNGLKFEPIAAPDVATVWPNMKTKPKAGRKANH
jgi:hypothetical protein